MRVESLRAAGFDLKAVGEVTYDREDAVAKGAFVEGSPF